jgi:hypothetical protein
MTNQLASISLNDLNRVTGAGGQFDAMMLQKQQQAQKRTAAPKGSSGPTELGNVCRDAYTATGGMIGAGVTSESLGWGAVPGTILGGMLGRALCPA